MALSSDHRLSTRPLDQAAHRAGTWLDRLQGYRRLARPEHVLFSIPLLAASLFLTNLHIQWMRLLLLVLVVASARVTSLILNRLIDAGVDAMNPRTADREIPAGKVSYKEAALLLSGVTTMYLGGVYMLDPSLLALSLVPLAIFTVYPFLKRWTFVCNMFVGVQLMLLPLSVWIACVGGVPSTGMLLYSIFVLGWGTGFEVIYAMADERTDRELGIQSVPARFGRNAALCVSAVAFVIALIALGACVWTRGLSGLSLLTLAALSGAFVAEVMLARAGRFIDASLYVNSVVSSLSLFAVMFAGA